MTIEDVCRRFDALRGTMPAGELAQTEEYREIVRHVHESIDEVERLRREKHDLHDLLLDAWRQWAIECRGGGLSSGGLDVLEDIEQELRLSGMIDSGGRIIE